MLDLPAFPWDTLADVKATAYAHPDGVVDLSIGSPVDPVAPGIQLALANAADNPAYPPTDGTPELRAAIAAALERRFGIKGSPGILPVVGSKEAIAFLPLMLGLGPTDTVIIPELAYPTYEVGARLAAAKVVRSDELTDEPALMFINSPSNPSGRVHSKAELSALVEKARAVGTIVASDECYLGLGWEEEQPYSILHEDIVGTDHSGLIAMHSLSKTSNLAGYRSGFFAGDAQLLGKVLEIRKHTGLMPPGPIQAATIAALEDDQQEQLQKLRYANRRAKLYRGLVEAGFRIDHSEAGLYLWATRGENGRDTVDWLAQKGILAAPGDFYGPAGQNYVRLSITATDERIEAAVTRLGS